MDQAEQDRNADRRQKPDPGRAGGESDRPGKEGADQHLAFQPDVENPRPFGKKTGQTGQ